jgi:dolichol-phosphate mannosyltransferase
MNKTHLSVVSPVYLAESLLKELVQRLHENLICITDNYEIILVEDGSPDKSWEMIEDLCKQDKKIKGIRLSRNFGQHYAITAGLDHVSGDWVIVMDCDLQDRPEEISRLYNSAIEGQYDIVLAKRAKRRDSFIKSISSKLFYGVLSYLTGAKQDASVANFGIYHKTVIASLQKLREPICYFPTMIR